MHRSSVFNMATKIKLDQGIYLTPLNSESLLEIQDNLESRCFMCREILTNENKTVEHIYPKWLQKHCGLWDQKITLPNGSTMPYRQYTVPCCKDCNGTVMADFENQIRSTILQGYNSFKGLNEEIIAWWLYKQYYAKLVKQLSLKNDIKNPESSMMLSAEDLQKYDAIYYYMCQLLKGVKFKTPKPYEIYVYKTVPEPAFDYIDDISRNVLYLKIHDVLIICALDSFNFFTLQYQEEVHVLDSLEIVHPLQGLELFAKMVYYKTHYKFDTEHKVIIDASGPYIENKIINATQIRPFSLKELYDLMKNVLQLRGVTDEIPEYVEGKMFSFIPRKV